MYGSIWDHFKDGLKHIDNPNFKFIWYEDMKKDSEGVIKELMKFTGYTLTDDKMSELLDITSVGSMRDAWGKFYFSFHNQRCKFILSILVIHVLFQEKLQGTMKC